MKYTSIATLVACALFTFTPVCASGMIQSTTSAVINLTEKTAEAGRVRLDSNDLDIDFNDTTMYMLVRNQRFSAFASAAAYGHVASFQGLPNVPTCCPEYTSRFDVGFEAGLEYMQNAYEEIHVGIRVSAGLLRARFSDPETTTVITDRPIQGEFIHQLDVDVWQLHFMPIISWEPIDRAFFALGGDLAVKLTSSYYQIEKIVSPIGAIYTDTKTSTRNESSGSASAINPMIGAVRVGGGYSFPLNFSETWHLIPQLWYGYSFPGFVQGADWSAHTITLGISISFDRYKRGPVTKP